MKKALLLFLLVFSRLSSFAQDAPDEAYQTFADSVNATFRYQTGTITLKDGIATLTVPAGFKYLDPEQSNYVLHNLWGNPASESSLGMLLPEHLGPLTEGAWVFDIEYQEMGYVKDDDADEIDYDELLKTMQQEMADGNAERAKLGYEPVTLVGWASAPFYDQKKHILHWAKEARFGDSETHTLNYNVRVLGRKGVLVLNAIASMDQFEEVNRNISQVENIVAFNEGSRYADYVPGVDEVAAYTVGGLVAGKVLAKVGFFALLLKFWKFIALGLVALGSWAMKLVRGRKNEFVQDVEQNA